MTGTGGTRTVCVVLVENPSGNAQLDDRLGGNIALWKLEGRMEGDWNCLRIVSCGEIKYWWL
jgi:hypothetical protein